MSTTDTIQFSDNSKVHIGSFVCSDSDVIIPIETARKWGKEQIGRIVKELCDEAEALNIVERWGWHEYPYHLQHTSDSELFEFENRVASFEAKSVRVQNIARAVKEAADLRRLRIERRKNVKKLRRQFSAIREKTFAKIAERDGEQCHQCGNKDHLTVDHVRALIDGGDNDLGNLQILCRSCNSKKGGR